ncbi:MAG: ABC transporter ATP-binding protein [Oscillospiraceae bacterium]|nr:ABC transporter ATP-binding protein [Oscillospiraceae bacterium]
MLLEAERVSKTYTRGGAEFYAVSDVSLSADAGELVCITGESGGGKSTLLGITAGLLPPTRGRVALDGVELTGLRDRELSRLRGTEIGCIPQGHSILANLSVIDNVRLPLYLGPGVRAGARERAAELLDRVGAGHLAEQYPSHLSGGELRRVSIARALLRGPKLLVADEPMNDLDPDNAEVVFSLFEEIAREGTAILLVTHDHRFASRCDWHFVMSGGRLTAADRDGAGSGSSPGR